MNNVKYVVLGILLIASDRLYAGDIFGGGGLGMGGGDTAFDLGPEAEEPTEIPAMAADEFNAGNDDSSSDYSGNIFNFGGYGSAGDDSADYEDDATTNDDKPDSAHTNSNAPGYHSHQSFYDDHQEKEEVYVDHHPLNYYERKKREQEEKELQEKKD